MIWRFLPSSLPCFQPRPQVYFQFNPISLYCGLLLFQLLRLKQFSFLCLAIQPCTSALSWSVLKAPDVSYSNFWATKLVVSYWISKFPHLVLLCLSATFSTEPDNWALEFLLKNFHALWLLLLRALLSLNLLTSFKFAYASYLLVISLTFYID